MMQDNNRITEAVNELIFSRKYAAMKAELTKIIKEWDTHPMVYSGRLSCLNALVDVGLAKPAAFDRLIKLVEESRQDIPAAKRAAYQSDLMQARRARIKKAVELYVKQKGPLSVAARRKYTKDLQVRWAEARDKFITERGELTWKERNVVIGEFWAEIDATLDKNLAAEGAKKRL